VVAGATTKAYWYDSKGIDLITYNTDLVDEIDIYGIAAVKSASMLKSKVKSHMQGRKRFLPD